MEKGPLRANPPDLLMWTDASTYGWGFHDEHGNTRSGVWPSQSAEVHINLLELDTIFKAVRSTLVQDGQTVVVYTDNCAAYFACLKTGSIHSPAIHKLYGQMLQYLLRHNITLIPRRIPGPLNVLADALSREGPAPTEWELDPRDFQAIQDWAGPFQVDLTATPFNAKLETFVCPFQHPRAAAVDAATTSWEKWQNIYMFPPIPLLDTLLPRILAHKGRVALVCTPPMSSARNTQLRSLARAELSLRHTPFQQTAQGRVHFPSHSSLKWIALLFSDTPFDITGETRSRKPS
jgi:hypothetical protein